MSTNVSAHTHIPIVTFVRDKQPKRMIFCLIFQVDFFHSYSQAGCLKPYYFSVILTWLIVSLETKASTQPWSGPVWTQVPSSGHEISHIFGEGTQPLPGVSRLLGRHSPREKLVARVRVRSASI